MRRLSVFIAAQRTWREVVAIDELANEPLVMFPRDGAPAVWDLLVGRLRPGRTATDAPIRQTALSGQGAMAEWVLHGDGVCPISQTLAPQVARPGLVLRPIEPWVRIPLILAWRRDAAALPKALADDLRGTTMKPRAA